MSPMWPAGQARTPDTDSPDSPTNTPGPALDGWAHPSWPGKTYQKQIVEKRYRLRVFGPSPGRPDERGEFVMIATAYGNRTMMDQARDPAPPGA